MFISLKVNSTIEPSWYATGVFSISFSSHKKHLEPGLPESDLVHKGEFIYYDLYVSDDEETLYVSLTALDTGDPDLVIIKSNTVLPTFENC